MKDATELSDSGHNPLDGYERFLKTRKTRFKRLDTETLSIDLDGQMLDLFWNGDDEALHCCCVMSMQLSDGIHDLAAPIFMHINRRQWLGHFELTDEGFPCFRYTMLFHGSSAAADIEVIEEITDIATKSCEQYAAAFTIMSAQNDPTQFPRVIEKDGTCAPLGLALLDAGGRG